MKTQTVIYRHKANSVVCFREAANIIKTVRKYNSEVELIRGSKTGTMKSILSIINLMIDYGDTVVIKAVGNDAEEVIRALIKII